MLMAKRNCRMPTTNARLKAALFYPKNTTLVACLLMSGCGTVRRELSVPSKSTAILPDEAPAPRR